MNQLIALIASIGWPQAALIFAILFVAIFFKPIWRFLYRVKSVGREGVTTEGLPAIQAEDSNKKQAVEELMKFTDSALLTEVESLIVRDLEQRGLESCGDSTRVLVRHLAATQIALEFEQVYNLIFGSQIFLLKKLNEAGTVNRAFTEKHFTHVQSLFPELLEWTMDQYLNFLIQRTLIRVDNDMFSITVKGVDFLLWMVRTRHSEDRLL